MQIGPKLAFSKAGGTRTPELSPKLQIKENQPPSPVGNNPIGRERLFHFIKQEETNMAYRKIYFRIHTECYSSGWSSDTDRAAFKEESRRLFQELPIHATKGAKSRHEVYQVNRGQPSGKMRGHSPGWRPERNEGVSCVQQDSTVSFGGVQPAASGAAAWNQPQDSKAVLGNAMSTRK